VGARVAAGALGACGAGTPPPTARCEAERDLVLIGLVALDDPDLVPWPTARALTTVPPIA